MSTSWNKLPQELRDEVDGVLSEAEEPIDGVFMVFSTENTSAVVLFGKIDLDTLMEDIEIVFPEANETTQEGNC